MAHRERGLTHAEEAPRFESSDVVSMFPTLVWKLTPDAGVRASLDRPIRPWIEQSRRGMLPLGPGESWQSETDLQRRDEFRGLVDLAKRAARGVLRFLCIGHDTLLVTGLWVTNPPIRPQARVGTRSVAAKLRCVHGSLSTTEARSLTIFGKQVLSKLVVPEAASFPLLIEFSAGTRVQREVIWFSTESVTFVPKKNSLLSVGGR